MIDASMIPEKVLEAAREAFVKSGGFAYADMDDILIAALSAWPGATYANWRDYGQADRLVLPLPKEGE